MNTQRDEHAPDQNVPENPHAFNIGTVAHPLALSSLRERGTPMSTHDCGWRNLQNKCGNV
eukprot:13033986-Alexandrium_andersonii.AAC.1